MEKGVIPLWSVFQVFSTVSVQELSVVQAKEKEDGYACVASITYSLSTVRIEAMNNKAKPLIHMPGSLHLDNHISVILLRCGVFLS